MKKVPIKKEKPHHDFPDVKEAVKEIPEEMRKKIESHRSHMFRTQKLTEDQQFELMELIARFSTLEEINEYFISNYRILINSASYYNYRKSEKWRPVIKKLREKYIGDEDEVAGKHRRVRLERADNIYHKALRDGDFKAALTATELQRREVEDKTPQNNISLTLNQYNTMSDDELEFRRQELLKKLKLNQQVIDVPKEE